MKELLLTRNDKALVKTYLKELDLSYIDKIMDLQDEIYNGLENKEFFVKSDKEEFEIAIREKGTIIGCVTENNELISIGVYIEYGYDNHNYGYDIGLEDNELLKVGQIEATIVSEKFRGNRLQKIMCEILENRSKKSGMTYICATVYPYNKYSLNTFQKLNYNIVKDKLKYGGLRRYVLMKTLK